MRSDAKVLIFSGAVEVSLTISGIAYSLKGILSAGGGPIVPVLPTLFLNGFSYLSRIMLD